jgi:hypothetical protein
MPRLLPRLLKNIINQPLTLHERASFKRSRRKTLCRRLPAPPTFSSAGRRKSILLVDNNPILYASRYQRHKSLPPRVWLPKNAEKPGRYDKPRSMTEQERSWWASPYCMHISRSHFYELTNLHACLVRMLSSPLRSCSVTLRYLPTGEEYPADQTVLCSL